MRELSKKRRESLDKNLSRMLDRIGTLPLPLRVAEVYIFGIYARMKEDPNDIDVMVVYVASPKHDSALQTLDDIVEKVSRSVRYTIPLAEFRGEVKKAIVAGNISNIPLEWVDHLKTHSLLGYIADRQIITNGMLTRGLRNVHISAWIEERFKESKLSRLASTLIWSEKMGRVDKPPDQIRFSTLLQDEQIFRPQLEWFEKVLPTLQHLISRGLKQRRIDDDLVLQTVALFLLPDDVVKELKEGRWPSPPARQGVRKPAVERHVTADELARKDKEVQHMRDRLKTYYEELRVANSMISSLRHTTWRGEQYLALGALLGIPKYEANEEDIRAALDSFGIKHDRVVKEYLGRDDYRVIEEGEDIKQVLERAELRKKQSETRNKYRSFISKYVKNTLNSLPIRPRYIYIDVHFADSTVRPSYLTIQANFYRDRDESEDGIMKFREEMKAMNFKVSHDSGHFVSMEMTISLSAVDLNRATLVGIVQRELRKKP